MKKEDFLNFDGDCNFGVIPKELIALYLPKSLFFTQCNPKKCYQPFDKSSHHDHFNMTLVEDSETAIESTDFPYVKTIGLLNRLNIIVEAGREECSIPTYFSRTRKDAYYKNESNDNSKNDDNEEEEIFNIYASISIMKSVSFAIVLIFFATLVSSESFKIKRDLTFNNKEYAINSPIVMNDEDFNAIEKRKV
uniref:Uncharacterized protein n=1 Tax=Strongyloides venezuelensis TaxID=75913 RepID=A0A0K0FDV3_STRVS